MECGSTVPKMLQCVIYVVVVKKRFGFVPVLWPCYIARFQLKW